MWSEIPREHALDEAEVHVRSGDTDLDLGPATSGSLTWCAGATYFVRDPQAAGEPARLLRWTDAGALEVVYESKGGQAFLSAPRCGGDRITSRRSPSAATSRSRHRWAERLVFAR